MTAITPPLFFCDGFVKVGRDFFRKTPRLISLDFDGTLAPIAATPGAATLPDLFRGAILRLSKFPETRLAVLSGRSLTDLRRKTRLPGVVLVGNHGSTFSPASLGWSKPLLNDWVRITRQALGLLRPLTQKWPGALLEDKGSDLSLHYRRARPEDNLRFLPKAIRLLHDLPVEARHGKCVLEFRPIGAPGKGQALERLASRFLKGRRALSVCVHIGDDQTDEDAFERLRRMGRNALGLKVGNERTRAHYRLRNSFEVFQFLNLFKNS